MYNVKISIHILCVPEPLNYFKLANTQLGNTVLTPFNSLSKVKVLKK